MVTAEYRTDDQNHIWVKGFSALTTGMVLAVQNMVYGSQRKQNPCNFCVWRNNLFSSLGLDTCTVEFNLDRTNIMQQPKCNRAAQQECINIM